MSYKNKGIVLIICSAFCFALMNTFVKLSGDLPSIQKSFFRNLVAIVFALIVILRSKEKINIRKDNLKYLFLRATLGTIGILGNFYAVDYLILSDASMIGKLSPFFAIIFSFIFLKEKTSILQAVSIVVAFIGSLFIIKPGFNLEIIPYIVGVGGAMCAGGAYTTVRYLTSRGEKGSFIVLFFSVFSCMVTLPYLIFNYHTMTFRQLAFLILAGLAASGGQFSVTFAYKYAPAKEISVFDYSQVIFAAIMGYFIMGNELPDVWSILGYIVICSVSVIMFIYNNKKVSIN